MISGDQFGDPRLTSKIPEIWWEFSEARDSILTYSKRVLDSGEAWMRIEQGIIPNLLVLPPFFADGDCQCVTAFVPIDDVSCMPMDIHRRPRGFRMPEMAGGAFGVGGESKSWSQMTLEEHQLHPLDYEAQSSQGKISLHSQEHLATSDSGVAMHRRLFKEQCRIVAEGGDPVGAAFVEADRRRRIVARSWMTAADSEAPPEPA